MSGHRGSLVHLRASRVTLDFPQNALVQAIGNGLRGGREWYCALGRRALRQSLYGNGATAGAYQKSLCNTLIERGRQKAGNTICLDVQLWGCWREIAVIDSGRD